MTHNPSITVTFSFSFLPLWLSNLCCGIKIKESMYIFVLCMVLKDVSTQKTLGNLQPMFVVSNKSTCGMMLTIRATTYLCVLNEWEVEMDSVGLAQVAPHYLARHIQMEIPTTPPACWKPLSTVTVAATAIVCQCRDECFIMGWPCC